MEDITGRVFNYLEVLERTNESYQKSVYWKCKCLLCGKLTKAISAKLKNGHKKSCGCLTAKRAKEKQQKFNKEHHAWKGYEGISGSIWLRIKTNAIKRGLAFEITQEQAWNLLVKQNFLCSLSGEPIYLAKNSKELTDGKNTASIDRIDSNKGYTIDNIQWLHVNVNYMKQQLPQNVFIELCKKIANNN